MPNMYTTTYRSYFTPKDVRRDMQPSYNKKSILSSENSSLQLQKQPVINSTDHLPPLNPRSTNSPINAVPKNNDFNYNMKPNVQRSGFWCENSVVDHQSRYEMRTTNQEMFGQPSLDNYNNNNKKNNTNKYHPFAANAMSPYVREPILIPSNNYQENNSNNDSYTTTMQVSYPKYDQRPVTIPSNVSMATTGFQRGSDDSIEIRSGISAPKMTKNEIERLKIRDPIAYLDAQNDNPYVSINQLCYQAPVHPRPF